ncbi:putative ATP-dependent helicase [Lachnellula subtilissima]|uniref:Putative ATP-dependent helicase n=1 Tax=Lachnellula subtilissima TaxID=602034 RepID=A0A8H8U7C1_9HELO|nr:putative ATP-dependent helicase [Lachnellula subtilissima]
MGRTKQTARRGQPPASYHGFSFRPFGHRPLVDADEDADRPSSPSTLSTPQNDRDFVESSSSSLLPMEKSAGTRKLPDELINFIAGTDSTSEPPRKKRKTGSKLNTESDASGVSPAQEAGLDHIVVRQSSWDIKCVGSKLSNFHGTIERTNVRPYVHWTRGRVPEYIEILNKAKQCVFHAPLPQESRGFEDVLLALEVDHDSTKWAKTQGKLWTEFGLELSQQNGIDLFRIVFTVKWNLTISPFYITQATAKVKVLPKVLGTYFPDQSVTSIDKWSPQDFYQSVHSPDNNDPVAASLRVDELESNLYPFQKRAVQWLLRKEGFEWSDTHDRVIESSTTQDSKLPVSFIEATDAQGRKCYVSHLFGLVTLDPTPFRELEQGLRGGILAEEMGLGKTVEMISLIALNKRSKQLEGSVFDTFTGQNVRPTSSTLIIAPPAIALQWISEIGKHAPYLRVMHYQGIKAHAKMSPSELLDALASTDIVVSSYGVLAAEINFTQLNPEKTLRNASKYPRPKSPLMALQFFRVVMDEAQMIESGVSNAAIVARMVPRVNAWCVTGTPVRKNVKDLLGLLVFLRYEPFASIKHVWSSLISSHKQEFRTVFGELALRHSKQNVREELRLPAQRRYVITMPFTPIEEQHYQELSKQMCEELGLNHQGEPLIDDWNPESFAEEMRKWLVRLRQTALHPEVGGRNRRALGNKDGPLRTVDQVLEVMMEQTELAIRTDQRALLSSKMKRGQLYENSPQVKQALEIWEESANEAAAIVEECREQLRLETTRVMADGSSPATQGQRGADSDSESSGLDEVDPSSRLGAFRIRLRAALEIEHMATFFCANAHFQIKSNEEMTKPESPEFEALEKLETDGYESAKRIRREVLQEVETLTPKLQQALIYGKADKLMKKISKKASSQSFVQIPEFPSYPPKGGLESRRIMEQLDMLATALDAQANQLDEWREQTVQFLLRPLVDEDEGVELTGDEYEESTKTQDEVMVYVQALRAVIADRYDALTGQENKLTEYDVKWALSLAKKGEGAFPEKSLVSISRRTLCQFLKSMLSSSTNSEFIVFCKGHHFRASGFSDITTIGSTKWQYKSPERTSIIDTQLNATQKQLAEQTKANTALEKELDQFTNVMNTRLEYYKQLQQVSDMVAPLEEQNKEVLLNRLLKDEEKLARKIASAKSKRRYLVHLKMEAANPQEQRICVICRDSFEVGALTVCGHQYCKECIGLWWSAHRNCPVCKKKLTQADLHEITYKPQVLSIEAEEVQSASQERTSPSSSSKKSAIYSNISKSKLAEIKNIDLDGPSFTTKVDTLARHLIWLRSSDPGAKSIIYSQFKEFLAVLARAFERFRIGYSSIDKPNGIEKFKHDPSVECFLLHARAHSSGLNLVNASHVFLCEPLLNTALELQAIARVDRIGQQQETNVWLYLVDGTVEESIHQLSVKRRMEHIGQRFLKGKGKARESDPAEFLDTNFEEANSMELQQASLSGLLAKGGKGGEMVEQEDLWDCLFGGVSQKAAERTLENSDIMFDAEVSRHLRAEAAQERLIGSLS